MGALLKRFRRSAWILRFVVVANGLLVASVLGQEFRIGGYQILTQTRVGRTDFEYIFRARLTNDSPNKVSAVAVLDASRLPNSVVLDGNLEFGPVEAGKSVQSTDTFKLRLDRSVPMDPLALRWTIQPTVIELPLAIAISSPADGTRTEATEMAVTGTVTEGASVSVNGLAATVSGGTFQANVPLSLGANTVTAVASRGAQQVQAVITIHRDSPPPPLQIAITSPADGVEVEAESIEVQGSVSGAQTVTLNGIVANLVDGQFSGVVNLDIGPNTIEAVARNALGEEARDSITVYRNAAGTLAVSILSPANGTRTFDNSILVQGFVSLGAQVQVNGFDANIDGERFGLEIALSLGRNVVTAVARDAEGRAVQDTVEVWRDEVPQSLEVSITSPSDFAVFSTDSVEVRGTVASGATVKVNGISAILTGNEFVASVPLVEGENILEAVAKNSVNAERRVRVSVTRVIPGPSVLITKPLDGDVIETGNVLVEGTVSSGAEVRINGTSVQPSNGSFSLTVPLLVGPNLIEAVARNEFGKETRSRIRVIRRIPPPQLVVASPLDGETIRSGTVRVTGSVSGESSVRVNGVAASVVDSMFDAAVPLEVGDNLITVVARNAEDLETTVSFHVTRILVIPKITLQSPVEGLRTRELEIDLVGRVQDAASLTINEERVSTPAGEFSLRFALREGRNPIHLVATSDGGDVTTLDVNVNRDTTAPILNIEAPTHGAKLATRQTTVVGMVNDVVPGTVNPEQVSVSVNGQPASVFNRSYELQNLLLTPGRNRISVVAMDRVGNTSLQEIEVDVPVSADQKKLEILAGNNQQAEIGLRLPEPLVVELVDANGVVVTNEPVTFAVVRNDGLLISNPNVGRELTLVTDENGQAQVLFQLGSRTGVGNNQVRVTTPGVEGEIVFCAGALGSPPSRVAALVPETQIGEAGKRLPLPWTAYVIDAGGNPVANARVAFSVIAGGGNIDGLEVAERLSDGDGRVSAFQILGPDPGVNNNAVLASLVGIEAGGATFTATGVEAENPAATRVVGIVLDHANQALEHATVSIKGTDLRTTTDAQGQFVISGAPVGTIHLVIEGSTVRKPGLWSDLEFEIVAIAGKDNSVDRPIYLLTLDESNAVMAGGNQDVELALAGIPGAKMTIKAHSVRDANGNPIQTRVMWTQVNLERVPMPPPLGSQFMLAWTVMPHGLQFDPPAQICIPNMGMPAGQVTEVFNFDHDIGEFVAVGTATVTSDGALMCSDPGFGVTKSGWGGCVPPPPPCSQAQNAPCPPPNTPCWKYVPIPVTGPCTCPYAVRPARITDLTAKANGKDEIVVCVGDSISFTSNATTEYCDGVEYEWDFNDGTLFDTKVASANTSFAYTEAGTYSAELTAKCTDCSMTQRTKSVRVHVLEIKILDKDDNEITSTASAAVAIKERYTAELDPASVPGAVFEWSVNGASPPAASAAIRTYSHATEGPHVPRPFTAADVGALSLPSIFWTAAGSQSLGFEVIIKKGTPDETRCKKVVTITTTQDSDPNRNIYATLSPDEDHNPNGSGGFYDINGDHQNWHAVNDQGMRIPDYPGAEFFAFHQRLITAHVSWRGTFGVGAIAGGHPIPGYATPSYLTAAGGNNPSRGYGYVRLGECANMEEVGEVTVHPWHNMGHVNLGGDMGSPATAIHAASDVFWRWHNIVDTISTTYAADKATVSATTPSDGGTAAAGVASVAVTFDLPVSSGAPAANVVQVTAGSLKVNGVSAASVTTVDSKTFVFTFSPAPIANGAATAVLTGRGTSNGFNGATWTFTVGP